MIESNLCEFIKNWKKKNERRNREIKRYAATIKTSIETLDLDMNDEVG